MELDPNNRNNSRPLVTGAVANARDRVARDTSARFVLGVSAPWGYGKSTALRTICAAYRAAGVPVLDLRDALAGRVDPGAAVVLADDLHRAQDAQLDELIGLLAGPDVRVLSAYRPWPRSARLDELEAALGRDRNLVLLRPFDAAQVGALLADRWGDAAAAEHAGAALAVSGGVPALVDRLVTTLTPAELADAPDAPLPRATLEPFREELAGLRPRARRFLIALALGVGAEPALLPALLETDRAGIQATVQAARATGLLDEAGALLPIARQAVLHVTPLEFRVGIQLRMIELQTRRGGPLRPLVQPLLGVGVGGATVANGFRAAGTQVLATAPDLAGRFLAEAVSAGVPPHTVAAQRAEAAARSGDFDSALRIADQAMVNDDPEQRARGASVAAIVFAHRGMLRRSATLFAWSGNRLADAWAGVHRIATGDLTGADDALLRADQDGAASLLAYGVTQLAAGLRASLTGPATGALTMLHDAHAMLEPFGNSEFAPETTAEIIALVALHSGEFGIAEVMLDRARETDLGGPAARRRHRLLLGWTRLLQGRPAAAEAHLAEALDLPGALELRDRLLAAGLRAGCARRANSREGMRAAWGQAREVVLVHSVDLFVLLPLGELAVAAARSGDVARITPVLDEAGRLLDDLGNPPLWSAPLLWQRVHVALITERWDAARRHVDALAALAPTPYQAALSEAAECWVTVPAGAAEVTDVLSSAGALDGVGLSWEAAQLVGYAALCADDRETRSMLLKHARTLRTPEADGAGPVSEAGNRGGGALSDHEQRIVDLLLEGLTYRDIGQRLFIAAKTVEYHVSRLRQRHGGVSRADLLRLLREPR